MGSNRFIRPKSAAPCLGQNQSSNHKSEEVAYLSVNLISISKSRDSRKPESASGNLIGRGQNSVCCKLTPCDMLQVFFPLRFLAIKGYIYSFKTCLPKQLLADITVQLAPWSFSLSLWLPSVSLSLVRVSSPTMPNCIYVWKNRTRTIWIKG